MSSFSSRFLFERSIGMPITENCTEIPGCRLRQGFELSLVMAGADGLHLR
jgi:hypothetical protein